MRGGWGGGGGVGRGSWLPRGRQSRAGRVGQTAPGSLGGAGSGPAASHVPGQRASAHSPEPGPATAVGAEPTAGAGAPSGQHCPPGSPGAIRLSWHPPRGHLPAGGCWRPKPGSGRAARGRHWERGLPRRPAGSARSGGLGLGPPEPGLHQASLTSLLSPGGAASWPPPPSSPPTSHQRHLSLWGAHSGNSFYTPPPHVPTPIHSEEIVTRPSMTRSRVPAQERREGPTPDGASTLAGRGWETPRQEDSPPWASARGWPGGVERTLQRQGQEPGQTSGHRPQHGPSKGSRSQRRRSGLPGPEPGPQAPPCPAWPRGGPPGPPDQ